jgi:hypothetical protein
LYLVHARVSAPNHLRFSYVESIRNEDKKIEHMRKCTEYFAEVLGFALNISAPTKKAWERSFREKAVETWGEPAAKPSPGAFGAEDLKLVNWYLHKVDPSFEPWEAAAKRQDIIRATMLEADERAAEQSLSHIPSPAIRVALLSILGKEDRLEKRVSDALAGWMTELDAPDEIQEYLDRYGAARSGESAFSARRTEPRLQTAQEALSTLVYQIEMLSNTSGALASMRESGTIGLMDKAAEEAGDALERCSPEDMEELAREIQRRANVRHGYVAFNERPPASFGPYVKRLKDKGLL